MKKMTAEQLEQSAVSRETAMKIFTEELNSKPENLALGLLYIDGESMKVTFACPRFFEITLSFVIHQIIDIFDEIHKDVHPGAETEGSVEDEEV